MEYRLTLPSLQASLDRLRESQSLTLAKEQIERLFGFNDVALARINRFALGHHCVVTHRGNCVIFEKVRAKRE